MKLRPYQEQAIAELELRFKKHHRVVGVAPTGSGKTVIGAAFATSRANGRVLWIAHRIELVRQAYHQLLLAGVPETDLGMLSGGIELNPSAKVLVATVGMFYRRQVPNVGLIVVDEAHHVAATGYTEILYVHKGAKVLGLTATPWRLDGEALGDVFEDLAVMERPTKLIVDGYIAEAIVYGIPEDTSIQLQKQVDGRGKDYSTKKTADVMNRQARLEELVSEWFRLAGGRATIVYACSLAHAEEIVQSFRNANVTAEMVDWSTPADEREDILGTPMRPGRLASGETKVVVNLGIMTEGIDCPPVKCIQLARPTKSLTLYRQMCGRGSRPTPDGARPIILDHAGNAWRFGLPDAEQEWSLEGRAKAHGTAPVKRCDACGCICAAGCKKCPQCEEEFPSEPKEIVQQAQRLERIQWSADHRKRREEMVRAMAEARGLDEQWVMRVLQESEAA